MNNSSTYPVGTPGQPWGPAEVQAWRARLVRQRSYHDDVVTAIDALRERFDVAQHGHIDYGETARQPLYVLYSRDWDDSLPVALVTGGVHGYEDSGVFGALAFAREHAQHYAGRLNVVIAPCVSPWAYEHVQRWTPQAVDPNRSFHADSPAQESAALMAMIEPLRERIIVHIDLHETTDTDETEFRPARAARDGIDIAPGEIPDGFYLCGDSRNPQPQFQQAVNAAVAEVTHIAPADDDGNIIGSPVVAPGVINYDLSALGLCASITPARFKTTTEVYPDSPSATPQQCNDAQVAATRAALDYALAHA